MRIFIVSNLKRGSSFYPHPWEDYFFFYFVSIKKMKTSARVQQPFALLCVVLLFLLDVSFFGTFFWWVVNLSAWWFILFVAHTTNKLLFLHFLWFILFLRLNFIFFDNLLSTIYFRKTNFSLNKICWQIIYLNLSIIYLRDTTVKSKKRIVHIQSKLSFFQIIEFYINGYNKIIEKQLFFDSFLSKYTFLQKPRLLWKKYIFPKRG